MGPSLLAKGCTSSQQAGQPSSLSPRTAGPAFHTPPHGPLVTTPYAPSPLAYILHSEVTGTVWPWLSLGSNHFQAKERKAPSLFSMRSSCKAEMEWQLHDLCLQSTDMFWASTTRSPEHVLGKVVNGSPGSLSSRSSHASRKDHWPLPQPWESFSCSLMFPSIQSMGWG